MSDLKVSCVIPVKNGASTIERAIKSAFLAGCDDVLVFDDYSTDNTWDILHSLRSVYLHGYSAFSMHTQISLGVNFGRNYMVNTASSGLIIPLDADDTLDDITPLRDTWQPNTWVYGNHAEVLNEAARAIYKGIPSGSLSRRNITGVTFLFHRDDWQRVGGYDPDFAYAEDYGFQCALTNAGVKPVYVDTVVYNRYMHPEGNERSALAGEYWTFYRTMARRKYPNVFAGMG